MAGSLSRSVGIAASLASLLLAFSPRAASAGGAIYVETLADGAPANDGLCTLREAILNQNAGDTSGSTDCESGGSSDGIAFFPEVTGTIYLASELPQLQSTIDLVGPGADLLTIRRDAGGDYPVLSLSHLADVSITGVTIENGSGTYGGGIVNNGILDLIESVVRNNTASGGGGGIFNNGTLTILRSTLSGNSAPQNGGIHHENSAVLSIENSTFSANSASVAGGGAIGVLSPGSTAWAGIRSSTFVGNTSPDADALFVQFGGGGTASATVTNSLFESSTSQTLAAFTGGTISSLGHNLASDGGDGFLVATGDLTNQDPRVGPLASNGSPVPTHEILPGSLALEGGDCFGGSITGDQRGISRPQDGACDIGAFERAETSLAGYWPLGEGAGTVTKDLSPAGADGVITGASWVADPTRGTALDFDGVDDFVSIASGVANLATSPFTITAWVHLTAGHGGGLLSKTDGDRDWEPGEKQLWFGDGTFGGNATRPSFVGFGNNYIISGTDVPTTGWHHLAIVWHPDTSAVADSGVATPLRKVYLDGVERFLTNGSYAANQDDNPGDTLRIGWDGSGEAQTDFLGRAAEVAVFQQALEGPLVRRVMARDFSESSTLLFADGFDHGGYRWSSAVGIACSSAPLDFLDCYPGH